MQASTDSTGQYRFTGVTPGTYLVHAEDKDHLHFVETSVTLNGPDEKLLDLNLTESATTRPIQQPPAFFDPPTFSVSGVTDTTNLGGHGSDTVVKTRNTLAKDAASLRSPGPLPSPETEASLRDIIERDPKNAEAHHRLADFEERFGQSLEAVHEYQRAAELNPSEEYIFDWGAELLLHHAAEPAIEVFQRGTRAFPQSVRLLIGQGAAWFSQGSYNRAVESVCAASDLDPDNPSPYLFLGLMGRTESNPPDAVLDRLHRFMIRQPQNPEAKYHYAVALWKRNKISSDVVAQVESLLQEAILHAPDFAPAHLQLGVVYSQEREFQKAISEYQSAIKSDPHLEEAHYRLAQVYRQAGEPDKAKAEIETYELIVKEEARQAESDRHQVQQFVYTLRDQPAQPNP